LKDVSKRLGSELAQRQPQWESHLTRSPGSLETVEREVHQVFSRLADEMVAGLLAKATTTRAFEARAKN
jgi:hypothetical protein